MPQLRYCNPGPHGISCSPSGSTRFRDGQSASLKDILDFDNGDMAWALALQIGRPPLPRVPSIAKAIAISPRALWLCWSTPSILPVPASLLVFQLHPVPARIDILEGEEIGIITHPALFEVTASARRFCSVRLVHSLSLSEAERVESLVSEISSACFFINCSAPETVLGLAKMSLWWLRELLRQEPALRQRHTVSKP